ncbi:MAG TPA: IgGFc-binding protein [Kofleriaceae bacterium]|nr:IgGFc-binding protein [Kofleriaceae bacterium]
MTRSRSPLPALRPASASASASTSALAASGMSLLLALALAACGPANSGGGDDGSDDDDTQCTDGMKRCDAEKHQVCSAGTWVTDDSCPLACDATLGCVTCVPNTGTCDGDMSHACRPDGSGYVDEYCDPVQGISCGASGVCEGACAPQTIGQSYVGCDYWPTVTGNMVSSFYQFAVAVSNTTSTPADVQIDGGGLGAPVTFTVAAMSTQVQKLPWVSSLKLCDNVDINLCRAPTLGASAIKGAYHLRSNQPVTVYQFNPLDYTLPGAPSNSYSNDASLLFPSNAWRNDYYVASYPVLTDGFVFWPSLMAVTAYQDGTQVSIETRSDTPAAGGAPAFSSRTPQMVTLNAGDVIELASTMNPGDLTGSHVTSNKPISVIGGHYCAYVPDLNWGYCDHMEETMLPTDALSDHYVVVAPAVTTIPQGKEEMVRIIATQANTTLTYDPPLSGAPTTIANAGDFVEIARNATSFAVTADAKILVAQYMEGSTVAGNTGDPAESLAVPVEQFRSNYLFHAPTNYETNYIDVVAPADASITLDGQPVGNFQPIGTSGFQLARVTPLNNGPLGDGNHSITGTAPFGIQVYGYGMDTSYWYPGGLDLDLVPIGRATPPAHSAPKLFAPHTASPWR